MREKQRPKSAVAKYLFIDGPTDLVFLLRSSVVWTAPVIMKRHASARRQKLTVILEIVNDLTIRVVAVDEDERRTPGSQDLARLVRPADILHKPFLFAPLGQR